MRAPSYIDSEALIPEPEACLAEAASTLRRGDLEATCAWVERVSQGVVRLTRVDGHESRPYAEPAERERILKLRTRVHGLRDEMETLAEEARRELELLRSRRSNAGANSTRWFESRA